MSEGKGLQHRLATAEREASELDAKLADAELQARAAHEHRIATLSTEVERLRAAVDATTKETAGTEHEAHEVQLGVGRHDPVRAMLGLSFRWTLALAATAWLLLGARGRDFEPWALASMGVFVVAGECARRLGRR